MQEKDEILNSDDDSNSCIEDHIRFKVPKEKKKVWDFFQADEINAMSN